MAESMQLTMQSGLQIDMDGITGAMMEGGGSQSVINNYTTNHSFTQNNTSPKPLNIYEIYRQTKNLIRTVKGR